MSFKSSLVFIKEVKSGESISYGHTYTAEKNMRVGIVPVGYGDGYLRAFSGKAEVIICRNRVRVLGRVTMDQIIVDLATVPDATIGSEVVLIGAQEQEYIYAEELAKWADTISYEITCLISKRVPRILKHSPAIARSEYEKTPSY